MSKARPECGTYSGYQGHRRRDENACVECLEAAAAYHRQWRKGNTNGKPQEEIRKGVRIRTRALSRLREAHPEEYEVLRAEEALIEELFGP